MLDAREGATGVAFGGLGAGGGADTRSVTAPLTFGQQQRRGGGADPLQGAQQQLSGAATPNASGRRSMGGTVPPGSTLGHPG